MIAMLSKKKVKLLLIFHFHLKSISVPVFHKEKGISVYILMYTGFMCVGILTVHSAEVSMDGDLNSLFGCFVQSTEIDLFPSLSIYFP